MKRKRGLVSGMTILLCTVLLCSGCAERPQSSSQAGASTNTTLTANNVKPPAPVTGSYDGQTITMQYKVITEYIWPVDNLRPYAFINGYAPFFYYGKVPEKENLVGGSYLDRSGRMICEPVYRYNSPFNADGRALVQKEDETWVYLNTEGKEIGICHDPDTEWGMFNEVDSEENLADADGFIIGRKVSEQSDGTFAVVDKKGIVVAKYPDGLKDAWIASQNLMICIFGDESDGPLGKYTQIYDTDGHLLNDTRFERVGSYEKGLAPFLLDGKLGLLDHKGRVVIPAAYEVDVEDYDSFILHENLILVNTGGRTGIFEIVRSN